MRRFAFIVLALAGCLPEPVNPDAEEPNYVGEDCPAYCSNMQRLGCEEGKPTPNGASCLEVCKNSLTGPVPFNTACASKAVSCEESEGC